MIHHRNSRCVDGAADALRPQRPAQNLAGSFAAVELAAAAVLELPALRRAQELPAVSGHAEDAEALAATVIGDRDRLTLRLPIKKYLSVSYILPGPTYSSAQWRPLLVPGTRRTAFDWSVFSLPYVT